MSSDDAVVRGTVVAKIHRMLDTIEARNAEIDRLRAEVERLRAEREAIEAIHQPMGKPAACCTCWKSWPCRTHLLLHPEDERRER